MHTATNYYLFSLAISDLLLLISGMPQEIYSIWSKWPYIFGNVFCVLRGLAAETSTNASVMTITLFTIERYLAICHPFVSHKMSKLSRAIKHVLLLWVASLALALPQALQFGIKVHRGVTMCLQTRVILEHSFEISTFFFFFAPMILITVLYSLIGLRLYKTNLGKQNVEGKQLQRHAIKAHSIHRKNSTQSTKRVVKMLVAVVVAFFVCWAPFHAQRLVAIYGTSENHLAKSPVLLKVYYFMTYFSGVFYYMSTCINPIFYNIMSNKFREAFKNTNLQWCCHNTKHSTRQRGSYSTMPFSRHIVPSGSIQSGNSIKKDKSSSLTKITYKKEEKPIDSPPMRNWKICEKCRRTVTTTVISYNNINCDHHANILQDTRVAINITT
ncbi:diapause hormone receptor [Danaus plexippus plexippus]|uniref:Diapause hormone receptor n=2 Tax=Danaus plexippus TaxID=13037 RepID=A0A212EQ65_DANPL|nr:diapause hormone receptor [Danaus plexippus plexippus]